MSVGFANRAEIVPADRATQDSSVNEFSRPVAASATEIQSNRAMQEVRAAYTMARQFPRNEHQAFANVMSACKRRRLAECAEYEYPRGSERITGPTIRLAEVLAQNWGHLDSGFAETEQRAGWSTVMAYAVDLQTGARATKTFQVEHVRHTRQGKRGLTDPRDIYELVANQAMRRVRACILSLIPGDLVEAAVMECRKTMNSNETPLEERLRQMVRLFGERQVTVPMIEAYVGMPIASFSENQLARMRRVYESLKDGIATREEIFDVSAGKPDGAETDPSEPKTKAASVAAKAKASTGKAKPAADGAPETPPADGEMFGIDKPNPYGK